jgi:hypothetical protein
MGGDITLHYGDYCSPAKMFKKLLNCWRGWELLSIISADMSLFVVRATCYAADAGPSSSTVRSAGFPSKIPPGKSLNDLNYVHISEV